MEDAQRARDDVLGRHNGMIPSLQGKQTIPVRIGFGRIDAPSSSGSNWPYAGAGSQTVATTTSESDGPATRALWIGSIPASTSQAQLLAIFSQYGPVESVRILTQKNCAFSEHAVPLPFTLPTDGGTDIRSISLQSTTNAWTTPSARARR